MYSLLKCCLWHIALRRLYFEENLRRYNSVRQGKEEPITYVTGFFWPTQIDLIAFSLRSESRSLCSGGSLSSQPSLQWRHNGCDGVSNHQPNDFLLNRLFRYRSKKTSKLHVTGLCAGNSPVTDEFPAQRASNAENVSLWWRHPDNAACYTVLSER